MQIYLVGGAVRDRLLGKPVKDRDWVVIGATEADMTSQGYQRVGADFPVFLHPETREEYALARTERKTAAGHKGFVTHFSPDVTLEEDLARRDLTINAIAQASDGELVDPFHGVRDLEAKQLRAVTEAFREDPLRILRVARFAAQLPGFQVEEHTLDMMIDMCAHGAMDELPGERVWQELHKALQAPAPERFFQVLDAANAWSPFFVELRGAERPPLGGATAENRLAACLASLAVEDIRAFCHRAKVPNAFRDFALMVVRYGDTLRRWREVDALELAGAVSACRGYHDADNLRPLLAYLRWRFECELSDLLAAVARSNVEVHARQFSETGPALGAALVRARAQLLRDAQRLQ